MWPRSLLARVPGLLHQLLVAARGASIRDGAAWVLMPLTLKLGTGAVLPGTGIWLPGVRLAGAGLLAWTEGTLGDLPTGKQVIGDGGFAGSLLRSGHGCVVGSAKLARQARAPTDHEQFALRRWVMDQSQSREVPCIGLRQCALPFLLYWRAAVGSPWAERH